MSTTTLSKILYDAGERHDIVSDRKICAMLSRCSNFERVHSRNERRVRFIHQMLQLGRYGVIDYLMVERGVPLINNCNAEEFEEDLDICYEILEPRVHVGDTNAIVFLGWFKMHTTGISIM